MTLPGKHWKWRMHGGAVSFAQSIKQLERRPDLILATDMLDVASFKGQAGESVKGIPIAMYWHENQLSYPWSPTDIDTKKGRDFHYGFINWTSALSADQLFFNSAYNRDSFLKEVQVMLKAMPDQRHLNLISQVAEKSAILPLGIELADLTFSVREKDYPKPVILWNHRWEYDKNPETFFKSLQALKAHGIDFELIVCGEGYEKYPAIFKSVSKAFSKELIHFGYAESRLEYAKLLKRANLIPVTSHQEFFGQSLVEAMAAGCYPLLPNRLAYPEHIPIGRQPSVLYDSDDQLVEKLCTICASLDTFREAAIELQSVALNYQWESMIGKYDRAFESLVQQKSATNQQEV